MRKKEVYYHIAGWSLYLLYLIVGQYLFEKQTKGAMFNYTIVFVRMVEFYICYLWVYPRFLNKGNIPKLVGGVLVALSCFILFRYLLEQQLAKHLFGIVNYWGYTFLSYTLDNIYFGSTGLILSLAVYGGFDALYKEQENKSLREEKVQAELAFLKTQINPHFLYNTLNYIYSLAYPVSQQLGDTVIKLSQLMRYMLTESTGNRVDLQKEVEYIENYISIFRLRFEDAFFVDFKTGCNIAGKLVAPLLLIPFVENAFKHGVVRDAATPIRILVQVEGKKLIFTVNNKINTGQKDLSTGVGLPNIRRRLELLYPGNHELKIDNNGEMYTTTLTINI
jgi:two-component system LytT family sensor kinase